jgi:hypothetical protein
MSLYREPGQARRRRRRIAGGAAVAALVVVLLVVLLAGGGSAPPTQAQRAAAASTAAAQALDGLELLQIEYGQAVADGRVVAPTEYDAAKADVDRARATLLAHKPDIAAVDPDGVDPIIRSLDDVAVAVQQRASAAGLKTAADAARARLTALQRAAATSR